MLGPSIKLARLEISTCHFNRSDYSTLPSDLYGQGFYQHLHLSSVHDFDEVMLRYVLLSDCGLPAFELGPL